MNDHQPPEADIAVQLHALGKAIDEILNGPKDAPDRRNMGYALLMFRMGEPGRMNYISNAQREDMIVALKELVANFEGRVLKEPETKQ